jgi:exonuclease SbcC
MRIVRVELKNIKSYRDAVVDLQRGVIAIRGHNGAGKSTLLEAIGWALFDYLPYNQQSFVREGENHGKVVVRFISAKDNREYEAVRRCGAGATWYIVDPETGQRYDSTADIHAFLRDQLRIDSTVALKDLFTSAIGVPQGSLTADFLMTPANRKKRFDALLQVEDYGVAVTRLNETVSYLKQRRVVQEAEIQGLERDVARLDEARAQLDAARASVAALEAEAELREREIEAVEARRGELLQAQAALARCEGDAKEATARLESACQRLERADALLTEARDAAEIVKAARLDHERYLRAEREQAAARIRQRDRDALRQREAEIATRQAQAETEEQHRRQRLTEVEIAAREICALQGDVTRQINLERARDEARQNSEKLREARERANESAATLATLDRAIAEREREAASSEAARAEAATRPERQRLVEDLQAAAAVRQQREARRAAIATERTGNASRREDAARDATKLEDNVRKLESVRALVQRLPELVERERMAKEAAEAASARLRQTLVAREQAGAGNCPFLAEPCLNIQRRGENSLRAYFDKRTADEERALAPLTKALGEATTLADDARTKAVHYERLGEFRERLKKAQAALVDCDATTARLDAEESEIAAGLRRAGDTAALAKARQALKASEDADKLLATQPGVLRDLGDKREQWARETAERQRQEALAASLAGAPDARRVAEEALEALGDPRGRVTGLTARVAERPALEDALAAAAKTLASLTRERAGITDALAPFTNLDAELTALERTLASARDAHTRYIQHEKTAEQLDARAKERESAVAERTSADFLSANVQRALAAARMAFDADELTGVNKRVAELSNERGANRRELHNTRNTIAILESDLERGRERIAVLEAARLEADELAAEETTLQQFRKLIAEAGPQVTRALLSQISQQANTIFGDIIGDRAGTLAWENDYEITLRRDGAVRSFAQLSGGEQMSAALAVRLALLRRLTRLDMAFFDEPTQNMDGERRSALAEQLRRVRGFEQLIVISHDDTFEQGLDGVIHLEKRDGATRVAEGEAVYASDAPLEESLSALAF